MYGKGLEIIGDSWFLFYIVVINILGFWKLFDILYWVYKHISVSAN
jgi:hypothetical protein